MMFIIIECIFPSEVYSIFSVLYTSCSPVHVCFFCIHDANISLHGFCRIMNNEYNVMWRGIGQWWRWMGLFSLRDRWGLLRPYQRRRLLEFRRNTMLPKVKNFWLLWWLHCYMFVCVCACALYVWSVIWYCPWRKKCFFCLEHIVQLSFIRWVYTI